MVAVSMSGSNTVIKAVLRTLDAETKTTQNRIATGLKVASYSDNATVWATAEGIRNDIKLADGIKSEIAVAKGRADTASTALKSILDRLGEMKDQTTLALASNATTATKEAAVSSITSLLQQVSATISSAAFKGVSYLTTAAAQSINIGVDDGASVAMSFATEEINGTGKALKALQDATIDTTKIVIAAGTTDSVMDFVTGAITQISAYANKVSSLSKSLDSQLDFLTTLNDVRSKAVGSMVDADLEEESARSKALEVRQQLAYQALAIGNSSQSNILLLFQ